MNRADRRRAAKRSKKDIVVPSDYSKPNDYWIATNSTPKDTPPKEEEIPGVTVPPVSEEFTNQVGSNIWHDRSELDTFIEVIKKLSVEKGLGAWIKKVGDPEPESEDSWSWAYNWNCKYINLRFDMRDGGFIMTNDAGERINIEQLKWQYRSGK